MDYSDTTYHYNQVISANGEIKPLQGLEEKSFVNPWAAPMVVYPWAAPMVIEIKPLQGLEEKSFVYPWAAPMGIEIKPLQGLEEKSFVYPWAAPMVIEIKPLQGLEENHFFMKEVQRTSISITSGATGGTINTIKRAPEGFNFLIDNL